MIKRKPPQPHVFNPNGYTLDTFFRDYILLERAKRLPMCCFEGYVPEEMVESMRKILEIRYPALITEGGTPLETRVAPAKYVIGAFRKRHRNALIDIKGFEDSVRESLSDSWKNSSLSNDHRKNDRLFLSCLLLREIARIKGDYELEYMCDERTGIGLDNLTPDNMQSYLKGIIETEKGFDAKYGEYIQRFPRLGIRRPGYFNN